MDNFLGISNIAWLIICIFIGIYFPISGLSKVVDSQQEQINALRERITLLESKNQNYDEDE